MIFSILAAVLAIGGALYALSAKHLMRGVLGLAFFFLGVAVFFADMGAWYLAVGQIFLFVGGVVTLFVLAFNFTKTPVQRGGTITGVVVALATLAALYAFLPRVSFINEGASLSSFAFTFFTEYGFVLNAAIFLLFSAIVGAQYLMSEGHA